MIGNRFYTWFKNYYQWVGGAFSETLLLPLVRATAGLRAGAIRYDETTNTVETYDGTNWNPIPSASGFVPNSRTITINGTTFDLSTNRIYTIPTHDAVTLGTANGLALNNQQLSLALAASGTTGALSAADWASFNAKQGAISLTTTGNSGASTFAGNVLNIPNYTISGLGGVPTSRNLSINGTQLDLSADRSWSVGTVTSVGLSMPAAFTVSGSPVTGSGTLAVTGAGLATQYVRGDGTLANFPTTQGGGSSVSYYLNGSVNQGTFGGSTYYEMNRTPVLGAGTNFSRNTDGYIASFITDANDPALTEIPGGNFNLELYFSASSGGGTPTFYVELYKYDGTNFTLIASNSTSPDTIVGSAKDAYFTALAVPQTTLAITDRLVIRIHVAAAGRTITLHTEDQNLCQVITTFSTGINTLNGLTKQVQFLTTGTSGTDFNINSTNSTHTFNIPTASATNRGALSAADWAIFNNKLSTTRTLTINGTAFDLSADRSWSVGTVTSVGLSSATSGVTITDSPVTVSGMIGIAIATANGSQQGLLSSTDWTTFNNKQNTLSLTTNGTSGAATLIGATLNIPQYQAQGNYITSLTGEATASGPGAASVTLSTTAVTGKLLTGLNLSGGGTIAATDSILTAFGKVQNQISAMMGGVTFQGVWNASTNTPTLTSSTGTKGHYYIVDVSGTTNLNGITDWRVGDWAIFNGSTWDKVDNTDAVSSVNGFTGAVSLTTSHIAEGTNLYYTDTRARNAISLTTTGNSGAATYTAGVLNVPQYSLTGLGGVPSTRQLTINGTAFDLSADRSWNVGTVTSVGLNSTTSGVNITNTPVTSSGALTINIATASGSQQGLLSSGDWTTFNNKQNALNGNGFVKISGTTISYDNSSYLPLTLTSTAKVVELNGQTLEVYGSAGGFTSGRLIVDPTFGAIGYQASGVFSGLQILTNGNATFSNTGVTRFINQVRFDSTLTNGTNTYNLPNASGTLALTSAMSGSTGQVAYFNGTNSVTGESNLFWDAANDRLAIGSSNTASSKVRIQNDNGSVASLLIRDGGTPTANLIEATSNAYGNSFILNAVGNLGLSVTPSAWGSAYKAMQIASGAAFYGIASDARYAVMSANQFDNGSGNIYLANGASTLYLQGVGQHIWFTAPSGTAGNAITFTQAMTLGANGNLLVGTTTDNGARLQVSGAGTFSGTVTSNGAGFIVQGDQQYRMNGYNGAYSYITSNAGFNSSYNGVGIFSNFNNANSLPSWVLDLGGLDGPTWGGVTDGLTISRKASGGSWQNRLTITSGGNVLIGTTTDAGQRLQVSGAITATNAIFSRNLAGANELEITNTSSSDNTSALLRIKAGNTNSIIQAFTQNQTTSGTAIANSIRFYNDGAGGISLVADNANAPLRFYAGGATERMRIKSGGQVRFVPLAADPGGAESGDVYYNSGTNKLRVYNGTSWVDLH